MTIQTPITNIAPALARAQKKIAVADRSQINTDYQSRFADLSAIILACREALAENEISILQPLGGSSTELLIQTVLLHSSGEMLSEEIRIRPEDPNNMDAVTSLVTKWRRYGLQSMLCIATKDDDGVSAKIRPAKPKVKLSADIPTKAAPVSYPDDPEPEKVSTSKQGSDWQNVVCHAGAEGGPVHGKKLGELDLSLRQWLAAKIVPTLGTSKKDKTLAEAVAQSLIGESDTVIPKSDPATAADALPGLENAVEPAKNAKEGASSEPPKPSEPMEWRSVVAHNFKSRPTITLGEIADSKPDALAKGYDGAKILRGMKSEGIAKIQAKTQTTKDKILVNAILAANEEMDLFEEVMAKFESVGFDDEKASAHLVKNGVFEDGERIGTAPAKILAYIRDHWSDVEKTINEAEK